MDILLKGRRNKSFDKHIDLDARQEIPLYAGPATKPSDPAHVRLVSLPDLH